MKATLTIDSEELMDLLCKSVPIPIAFAVTQHVLKNPGLDITGLKILGLFDEAEGPVIDAGGLRVQLPNAIYDDASKADKLMYKEQINKWFRRRQSTAWSAKELRALDAVVKMGTESDDFSALSKYYSATIPQAEDYRRRDVLTLLNNWAGEIDRARKFNPAPVKTFAVKL